jgi:hypothetical protein
VTVGDLALPDLIRSSRLMSNRSLILNCTRRMARLIRHRTAWPSVGPPKRGPHPSGAVATGRHLELTGAICGAVGSSARRWRVWVFLLCLVASAVPARPAAAELSLIGGTGTRTIELTEKVDAGAAAKAAHGHLTRSDREPFEVEGTLNLDVRNTAAFPVKVRLLYSRPTDGSLQILPGHPGTLSILWPKLSDNALRATAARLGRYLTSIARSRARTASRRSTDAAGVIAAQLSAVPGRPSRRQLKYLARLIASLARAPGSVAARNLALALVHVICPQGRHCPQVPLANVRVLMEALEETARDERAGRAKLVSDLRSLITATRATSYPSIPAHTVTQIWLRVRTPDSSPPETLDGTIELQGYTTGAARPAGSIAVPMIAKVEAVGDVRFEPSDVVIRVARWCFIGSCGARSAAVQLFGAGVGKLIAVTNETTRIYGELTHEDRSLQIALERIESDPRRIDAARAQVTLLEKGAPKAGKYSGVISISHLIAGSPSIKVEVESRIWEVWAVLLVGLGVAGSGFVFQALPVWRRRSTIRSAINERIKQLRERIALLPPQLQGEPVVVELKRKLTGEYERSRHYEHLSAEEPASILSAAEWARNEEDMAEVVKVAGEFVVLSRRWETGLEQLAELQSKLPERSAPALASTKAASGATTAAHQAASGSPRDLLTAPLQWYLGLLEAWRLRHELIEVPGHVSEAASRIDLATLDKSVPSYTSRSPAGRRSLDAQLETVLFELEALRREAAEPRSAGTIEALTSTSQVGSEPLAEAPTPTRIVKSDPYLLVSLAARPLKAPSATAGSSGNLPIADVAAERPRTLAGRIWLQLRPIRLSRRARPMDILVTVGVIAITALAYTATIYNNEWGSFDDAVGAFGAGFIGRVTLNWGLLPIFRSVVLRVKAGEEQTG